ncbi:50S ribosomal protein L15 [Patescibacteria group bacterium]|nr:50S ribosomal protein L15 [Patescibacteria group bacterium]
MSMLNTLKKLTDHPKKRVGRGYGTGKGGHTVGRGTKGQRARKSGQAPAWFEGGQLPMIKRLPMQRGKARFNVLTPTAAVTLSDINKMKADVITLDALKLEKVIHSRFQRAKIIANGKIERKVIVRGLPTSAGAAKQIEQAGGSVESATA